MFYSCPHCRDLVATDRDTRLPPELCPRCGGTLRQPEIEAAAEAAAPAAAVASGLSFASMLRGDETAEADASAAVAAAAEEVDTNELQNGREASSAAIALCKDEEDTPSARDAVGPASVIALDAPESEPPTPVIASQPVPPAASRSHGQAPSFTRMPAPTVIAPRAAKWQWAAVFVLASLLVVQVLVADRARLAAEAGWRPMITALCSALRCSVPAWHQTGAISMLSRDVSPLAGSNGGLDVRATFRNDARWSQPWPVLLLSLSDADGRVLGSRAFLPHEYLGPDATQTELAPGQSARIALKLHEPNPDVVAFSFDFR